MGGGQNTAAHFRQQNSATAKVKQYAFVTFLLNMSRLHNAMLIGGTPRTFQKSNMAPQNRKYASRLLSFVAHIISRVPGLTVRQFQRLYPCFRGRAVQQFITSIHTRSNYISGYMRYRRIPTNVSKFSWNFCPVTTTSSCLDITVNLE